MWHQGFNRNFTKLREYFLCANKTIITIYSTILLPELPSSAILESIPERNQRCLRSVDSAHMLNVNNADYVDYVLGYSPKWRKTVTRGEELLNKLCYYCQFMGQRALRFHQKYLHLCSEDERRPYGFGTTWGWVINDRISNFGWTIPLNH